MPIKNFALYWYLPTDDPGIPTIETSRFVLNQEATVTCYGNLGNPLGSRNIYLERRLSGETVFTVVSEGDEQNAVFSTITCAFNTMIGYTFTVLNSHGNADFMCRTTFEKRDLNSTIATVTATSQGK